MSTKSNNSENYYSILNCSQSASYDELKQSYQELIRKYHPDKGGNFQENFLSVDKAWKTLRDEETRNQYDIYLQTQMESDSVVHTELSQSDLRFNDENVAKYPCRCGGSFIIQKDFFEEEEWLVECDECSNCILVKRQCKLL